MPYIEQEKRKLLDDCIGSIIFECNRFAGHGRSGMFTYVVYRLLKGIFTGRFVVRALGIGCMVCAMLEWYRRDFSVYEDEKITNNKDRKTQMTFWSDWLYEDAK